MSSMLKPADREVILARLRRLDPTARARWGRFTAPQMVAHLSDALRVAVGETQAARRDPVLSRTLAKWLVVYTPMQAPRGRIQTAPEMLRSNPTSWETDLATCESLVRRLVETQTRAVHPAFGPLSHAGWGRLTWKHFDHHLHQFGV